MELLKDFDNKDYINQELVVKWLSDLFIPFLNQFGFAAYSKNKKFKKETKDFKQIINIDFANYQFVAYSPRITLTHTDKTLERGFNQFWNSIGKTNQGKYTFWANACSPKNNMGLIDELGYKRFPSITNYETALETFEKFKLFFENDLYKTLIALESPENYLEIVNIKSPWDINTKRTKENFWFWSDGSDFSEEYKKYFYLRIYYPNILDERKINYLNSFKERDWELTEENLKYHDNIFNQIKLLPTRGLAKVGRTE